MPNISSPSVVLLTAGGHAKVVADICLAAGYRIAGFLDDVRPIDAEWTGGKIIGRLNRLSDASFAARHLFIPALGDNAQRRDLAEKVRAANAEMISVVHPSAVVSSFASIGLGTVIMPGAVVNAAARIGDFCILNSGCTVDHDCVLEDGCQICPGANLAGNVYCGQDVFVGIGASIIPKVKLAE
ncbi:MAG TPA: acetyltransferase, partial [Rhodospirillales bacterium]|nr:acetyltransferase [Rhodospirillales bacterium]